MILDKALVAMLSRMTHSRRANSSSVSTLDGRGAETAVCEKKKKIEMGCMRILVINIAGPYWRNAYGKLSLLLLL